jgi:hypothetical protein
VTIKGAFLCVVIAILSACPQQPANAPAADPASDKIVLTGDQNADWAQIIALENQAKALVQIDGCSSGWDCRTAPVGSRACGGPRYYLIYCSRTTDSVALFRKLAAVAAAERQFNAKYQLISTCEFRTPPKLGLSGTSCQSTSGQ